MKRVRKRLVGFLIALSFIFILTSSLGAATFTVGSNTGSPGDKDISIPIDLSSEPGEEACSFNFDLIFDTSMLSFKKVTLGSVAVDAGKSLSYSQPSFNTIRVVVIGFNQKVISDGEVLTFTFDILDKAPRGKTKLTITKPSISDPKGKLLPANTDGGGLHITK